MEIKGDDYCVRYVPEETTVYFEGTLRLSDYQPIEELLERVVATQPKAITLDLRALSFLNSSGINVLYKVAVATRKGVPSLVVRGSKTVPWQEKSLPNMKKFNSNSELLLTD